VIGEEDVADGAELVGARDRSLQPNDASTIAKMAGVIEGEKCIHPTMGQAVAKVNAAAATHQHIEPATG
jgi:hypothetical protein